MSTATNAVLLSVHPPGAVDAYGEATPAAAAWEGRAPGYLKRGQRAASSRGQAVDVRSDVLTVRRAAAVPVLPVAGGSWEGWTVVVEDRRTPDAAASRFRVAAMENRAGGTIADSFRLELADEEPIT